MSELLPVHSGAIAADILNRIHTNTRRFQLVRETIEQEIEGRRAQWRKRQMPSQNVPKLVDNRQPQPSRRLPEDEQDVPPQRHGPERGEGTSSEAPTRRGRTKPEEESAEGQVKNTEDASSTDPPLFYSSGESADEPPFTLMCGIPKEEKEVQGSGDTKVSEKPEQPPCTPAKDQISRQYKQFWQDVKAGRKISDDEEEA